MNATFSVRGPVRTSSPPVLGQRRDGDIEARPGAVDAVAQP
ncbi:hypothetical protein [Streptomyces sioyaensis]